MTNTILILSIVSLLLIIGVVIYFKSKAPKDEELEKIVESVKENLKEDLHDSATKIVKRFLWYCTFDPNKPADEQTIFNRTQRRRIKRHYEKFLWKWTDIPEELQNVEAIVQYLASTKWETRLVRRYIVEFSPEKKRVRKKPKKRETSKSRNA